MAFSFKNFSQILDNPDKMQILLGVAGVIALIFGLWQLKTNLYLPLSFGGEVGVNNTAESTAPSEDISDLQQADSDKDGLSDYDELYVYKTSPYLTDSDSDGFGDKTEVDSGNDPTCPSNGTCGPALEFLTSSASPAARPSAEEIRALLKKAGASDDELAKYDDDTLLSLYNEVAGELGPAKTTAVNNEGVSLNLTPEQKELIKQMSASELRQFLINGGADPKMLQEIDDNTLKAIVYQELGI